MELIKGGQSAPSADPWPARESLGWGHPVPLPQPPTMATPGPIEQAAERAVVVREERRKARALRVNGAIANLATIAIAAIAGYISWLHLFALGMSQQSTSGLSETQETLAAQLTPFSLDGMILVGTLKLRQSRLEGRPAHWASYAAVFLGVIGTIAGNVASAPDSITARLLAAAPPVAFLLAVEALFGRPLSRTLWEILRGAWERRAERRQQRHADRERGARDERARYGPDPARSDRPPVVKVRAEAEPVGLAQTSEKPQEPSKPSGQTEVRAAAPKAAVRPLAPAPDVLRDDAGRVVGTKRNPARLLTDGTLLVGDLLKADARRRATVWLAAGEARNGLAPRLAGAYDPPMSTRWAQERIAELPKQDAEEKG